MSKKVLYRISLDPEKDADVIESLEKCPRPLRGEYVAEAIRLMKKQVFNSQDIQEEENKPKEADQPNLDFGSFFK
ncbi:MAG: hypothetical protein D6726_02200 [Nitrospirae bacterium]|nr:MAG: hypothetical protein D6726_02200 [Nitrospirota bacterium]